MSDDVKIEFDSKAVKRFAENIANNAQVMGAAVEENKSELLNRMCEQILGHPATPEEQKAILENLASNMTNKAQQLAKSLDSDSNSEFLASLNALAETYEKNIQPSVEEEPKVVK